MNPRNAKELIEYFDDNVVAANFARSFLSSYLTPALGVLSKTEVDLLVFSRLVEARAIDPDGPSFTIVRTLNITPQRVKSLLFQYQLRNVSEAETDAAILRALNKARYRKDGSDLAFGIESPLVRTALAAKMREQGVFADISLSGDILRVSPEQFGDVIAALLPSDLAKALAKKLKKHGVDESAVRNAVKRMGSSIAEDFIKDQAKSKLGDLLGNLWKGAAESAPDAIDFLSDTVSGFM